MSYLGEARRRKINNRALRWDSTTSKTRLGGGLLLVGAKRRGAEDDDPVLAKRTEERLERVKLPWISSAHLISSPFAAAAAAAPLLGESLLACFVKHEALCSSPSAKPLLDLFPSTVEAFAWGNTTGKTRTSPGPRPASVLRCTHNGCSFLGGLAFLVPPLSASPCPRISLRARTSRPRLLQDWICSKYASLWNRIQGRA